jgi:hypothetical protein
MGAHIILLFLFLCFTAVIGLRVYKYISYRKLKTLGCLIHLWALAGTCVGSADFIYRIVHATNLNGEICFMFQVLVLVLICTAYNIAVYHWIVVYNKAAFQSTRVWFIIIFSTQTLKLLTVAVSIALYFSPYKFEATILYVAVGAPNGLGKALLFGIYGAKIIRHLHHGNSMQMYKLRDDFIYKMTVRTTLTSFAMFAGIIEVGLYFLQTYELMDGYVAQIIASLYRLMSIGFLLNCVKPPQGRSRRSQPTALTKPLTSVLGDSVLSTNSDDFDKSISLPPA